MRSRKIKEFEETIAKTSMKSCADTDGGGNAVSAKWERSSALISCEETASATN